MCGIVGYLSSNEKSFSDEKKDFMRRALILDTFRGPDSTGVMGFSKKANDILITKALGEGWDFVRTREFDSIPHGRTMVGHNRAATRGAVTLDNAHPFETENLALVHNGTLLNDGANLPMYRADLVVDSLQIARAISHVDPQDAHTVLSMLRGSYALVWYDLRDKTINVAKNSQRPLHFTINQSRTFMMIMSDARHLEIVSDSVARHTPFELFRFSDHVHFKWSNNAKSLKPRKKEYQPSFTRHNNFSGGWDYSSPKHTGGAPLDNKKKGTSLQKIYVGDALIPPPRLLLEDMELATGLEGDYLDFSPKEVVPYLSHDNTGDQEHGMALGSVIIPAWECEWPCVVHNVNVDMARKALKNDLQKWRVLPYALSSQTPMESENQHHTWGLMARVVRYNFYSKSTKTPKNRSPWPGPHGESISYREWADLTTNGCGLCGATLIGTYADRVVWGGEDGETPICDRCVEETECSSEEEE